MLVKQGAEVKAGEPLFFNKSNEKMVFVSPVSGELVEIVRGARRRILTLKILADKSQEYAEHGVLDLSSADDQVVRDFLLKSGAWPFIKQRPYDIIANPEATPKAIFISAYATAPLAADADFALQERKLSCKLPLRHLEN